ncbi:MAG: peptidylprolyl isomerase [Pseudomonadota bacterium]
MSYPRSIVLGRIAVVVGIALASGVAFAATSSAVAVSTPVAKAGSVELGESELRHMLDALSDSNRQSLKSNPSALAQAVRGELLRRNVLAEARASGFEKDPAVAVEVDRVRDEIMMRLWVAHEAKLPAGYPSDEDVKKGYDVLRDRAARVSDYRLAQIYIAAQDGAAPDKVQAALRKVGEVQAKLQGGDFGALAKAYSEHVDSAAKGGDLGTLAEAQLLPEVRAVLPAMKPGETAGPIKTAQGIHFIRLTERKPASVPPLAEVRGALVVALQQDKMNELQQRYLKELAQKFPPTINELELAKLGGATR